MKSMRRYVDSLLFPLTLGILAFIGWVTKFSLPSAIIYAVLAFAPFFGRDGRSYLALILLSPTLVSSPLSFKSIEPGLLVVISSIALSLLIFAIVRHPPFTLARLSLPILILFLLFTLSLLVASSDGSGIHTESGWFLLGMFAVLAIYAIIVPLLYKGGGFVSFAKSMMVLTTVLAVEVFCFYGRSGFKEVGTVINLGWVQSSTMASTILVASLPFSAMFLRDKHPVAALPLGLALVALYQLRTVSGLIASIIVIIPLIFMVFKSYAHYPYFVVGSLTALIFALGLLFLLNDDFLTSMAESLRYLGRFFQGEIPAHRRGIELFLQNPLLGPSINSLSGIPGAPAGYIQLLDNTVITTMVMGGSLGLAAYAGVLGTLTALIFQRKNPQRYFFLLNVLIGLIIGLVDNTFYNLFYMFIFLLTVASYESSSRKPRIEVSQNFFDSYASCRQ